MLHPVDNLCDAYRFSFGANTRKTYGYGTRSMNVIIIPADYYYRMKLGFFDTSRKISFHVDKWNKINSNILACFRNILCARIIYSNRPPVVIYKSQRRAGPSQGYYRLLKYCARALG